ncbi:MAG TPA: NADH-quinone oxidoreductase subunit NuoG, partial [Anaerolineae bacterium]|nr:NADH-quinone oxidoreductase subunit NuoG [Anaerolineae bacterium]
MTKLVTLTIDGKQVIAEQGTLVVDAAKNAGIDIPVLCYHPKMEPVGMCRMCLVEIGRPLRDRKTGELVLEEDGSPKIQFGRNLETACTTPVSEGMIVNGLSEKVREARKEVLEFLLTSHPLDCPVCDKGGECALQNLTLEYGPVTSRFKFDDKIHFQKHIPLSDLIFLDRERCILCGRCIRFQDEIVGDPVIAFDHRGRSTEVFTNSDPGFDSYWSGNTTDLCPVGALTTADFRFGSRPWELNYTASLSPHSPVGANLSINVRREAKSNGQIVIKRIMPRQNEWVNEIWISDKDRFGYHFYESEERLLKPLVRENGELKETSWENALDKAAQAIKNHREGLLTLVSGRLSNEDLFNAAQITKDVGGKTALYTNMAGGDLVSQVGLPPDSNFKELGAGTTILVIASDLEEEAPIWWLRTKQASERGATLIVANPRPTKRDRYADFTLRYAYGEEAAIVESLMDSQSDAAKAFTQAENAVVIFGSEGTGLESSTVLATACADLLLKTNHVGRPNNGLIGVWQRPNTQGAWDMGFRPVADLAGSIKAANILYIIAADPLGDNPALKQSLQEADFVIVQELFLTETAKLADIVLPAQTLFEREGTFTSGERRVQRFYPAVSPRGETLADFDISSKLGVKLGLDLPGQFPSLVMPRICETFPAYQGITYQKLAQVIKQNPIIGREDLYYGGTSYENKQGLGLQLPLSETNNESTKAPIDLPQKIEVPEGSLLAVPVTRLYDRGQLITKSEILQAHIPE